MRPGMVWSVSFVPLESHCWLLMHKNQLIDFQEGIRPRQARTGGGLSPSVSNGRCSVLTRHFFCSFVQDIYHHLWPPWGEDNQSVCLTRRSAQVEMCALCSSAALQVLCDLQQRRSTAGLCILKRLEEKKPPPCCHITLNSSWQEGCWSPAAPVGRHMTFV